MDEQGEAPRSAGTSGPGGGQEPRELRRRNLSTLLEHVHLAGPMSRSQLAAATALNRSTIADLVAELSSFGLVAEGRAAAPSGPGRPSPLVAVVPERAVALA